MTSGPRPPKKPCSKVLPGVPTKETVRPWILPATFRCWDNPLRWAVDKGPAVAGRQARLRWESRIRRVRRRPTLVHKRVHPARQMKEGREAVRAGPPLLAEPPPVEPLLAG